MDNHLPNIMKRTGPLPKGNQASQLSIHVDGKIYPILKMRRNGFALDANSEPPLRGLVRVFDGAKAVFQCLIVHSEISGKFRNFEFKSRTPVRKSAPLDYASDAAMGQFA